MLLRARPRRKGAQVLPLPSLGILLGGSRVDIPRISVCGSYVGRRLQELVVRKLRDASPASLAALHLVEARRPG